MDENEINTAFEQTRKNTEASNLHHFSTRLWERHHLAATPDAIDSIKAKLTKQKFWRHHKGKDLYRIRFMGRSMVIWTIHGKELYTVT